MRNGMQFDEKKRVMQRLLDRLPELSDTELVELRKYGMTDAGFRHVQENLDLLMLDKPKPTLWQRIKRWFRGV